MAGTIITDNTALAADFINKAEADAVPANDEGRVAKLESDGKIDRYFLGNKVALPAIKDITVGATPVLVSAQNGDIVPAINSDTERVSKLGFLDATITPTKPSFVNVSSFTSSLTGSITANIGTNRILIVRCYVPFSIVPPTTASWGASAMTLVETTTANDTYDTALAVFALPIGDSLVNETKTLTLDVASYVQAVTIDNIAQSNYLTNDYSWVTGNGAVNTVDASNADLENGYSMRVAMGVATGGGGSTVTGAVGAGTSIYNGVEVASTRSVIAYALGNAKDTASNLAITMNSNTNTDTTAVYIIGLRAYVVNTTDVRLYEKVSGFTGLIAGAMYYIGSTEGTLTVIKNAYPVGVAVSATEINILK